MRFIMFMIPAQYQPNADGTYTDPKQIPPPSPELAEAMMTYNVELSKACKLIGGDGLAPMPLGVRVSLKNGEKVFTDGPYTESKEVVGGYWLFEAADRATAVEWAKKVPLDEGSCVELRPILEMADFPEDVQEVFKNANLDMQVR